MRKLLLLLLIPAIAQAQTYNQFKPANGILKGSTSTYATTAATSADVDGLYASPVALTGTDINTSNQVTATHLSGPLPATQGGTGQTTITLGDLLYGSASNVLSKLTGNTTASKRFLTQTGDGANSAAPAWAAIVAADIQGLAAGSTTQVQYNSSGSFAGSANMTFNGTTLSVAGVNLPANAATPTNGIYNPSGNQVVISTNGSNRVTVSSVGLVTLPDMAVTSELRSTGTKPTVTGCSNSSTLGGAVAGSFLSGTTGTCSVTITLPAGPTNGYACFAHDDTTAADYTQSAIVTSTTTLTISGTTVSGDKIVWGCPLGY